MNGGGRATFAPSIDAVRHTGSRGKAHKLKAERFLDAHPASPLYTSRICWGEFAEGCETMEDVVHDLERFAVLELDEEITRQASRIARDLKQQGLVIGENDTWIAATALVYDIPVVTLNEKHFRRVAGLKVEPY